MHAHYLFILCSQYTKALYLEEYNTSQVHNSPHTLTRGSQSPAESSEPVPVPILPISCEQPVGMMNIIN